MMMPGSILTSGQPVKKRGAVFHKEGETSGLEPAWVTCSFYLFHKLEILTTWNHAEGHSEI